MSLIDFMHKWIYGDKPPEEVTLSQPEPESPNKLFKAILEIQFTDGTKLSFWSSDQEYCDNADEKYWKSFLDWYIKGKKAAFYMHTEAEQSTTLILRKNIYSFGTYFREM